MNANELKIVLAEHAEWLADNTKGKKANLSWADLTEAILTRADLFQADLTGADLPEYQLCPQDTVFIGYKKVSNGTVLKLEITGLRTSSLVGRKCRTSEVKVLEAFDSTKTEFKSLRDSTFMYKVGETVKADYDSDIRVECTKGIHFFLTRKEAEEYI